MKVPDSGMPDEAYWESLFDIPLILDRLSIGPELGNVAEMGCGYGTFTVPVAERISGTVFTFDIEPAMLAHTATRAAGAGVVNVRPELRDVASHGFGLPEESCDAVLLFNILHGPQPEVLLQHAAHVLPIGARILVIHWRSDVPTPRGPPLPIRPSPDQVSAWARGAGFETATVAVLPPWHFGIVLFRSGC